MSDNGAKTEHVGAERADRVQVCVASGPGWSLFWPRAAWEGLSSAKRRKVIKDARRRYAPDPADEYPVDPFDELVEQGPPDWREWGNDD